MLQGKLVLITGAGSGLGKAIASELACEGALIVAADVDRKKAADTAEEILSRGFLAEKMFLDVSDDRSAELAINKILEKHGRIDVLVNNAGIDFTKSAEELTIKEWDKVLSVNLRGPFLLSKKVFPVMSRQGQGQIINITSTAAKRTWPNASAYHASKWGLLGLSHALFTEGRAKNIRVTAVVTGGMRTPFILDRFPEVSLDVLQDPKNVAETVKFVLNLPAESVIPEILVIPLKETSWP